MSYLGTHLVYTRDSDHDLKKLQCSFSSGLVLVSIWGKLLKESQIQRKDDLGAYFVERVVY